MKFKKFIFILVIIIISSVIVSSEEKSGVRICGISYDCGIQDNVCPEDFFKIDDTCFPSDPNCCKDYELCGNARDENCDGSIMGDCPVCDEPYQDLDYDGFCSNFDCNDNDPSISIAAPEICGDGVDNNCNGMNDDVCPICTGTNTNNDHDGYCSDLDCNDDIPWINPGMPDLCGNLIDDNCDGLIDNCCQLTDAYWDTGCIGSEKTVTLTVNGIDCNYLSTFFDVNEIHGYRSRRVGGSNFINNEVSVSWDAEYEDGYDVDEFVYEFIATTYDESWIKSNDELRVTPCTSAVDQDCDRICNPGVIQQEDYQCEVVTQGDECPNTPYCTKVDDKNDDHPGCSEGQASCLIEWDCTPGWWNKPGETRPRSWADSDDTLNSLLTWSECNEDLNTRERQICPNPLDTVNCCTLQGGQDNCYCKMPAFGSECYESGMRPAIEKSCLPEEAFPFFTTLNILLTILLISVFYLIKVRSKKKGKK